MGCSEGLTYDVSEAQHGGFLGEVDDGRLRMHLLVRRLLSLHLTPSSSRKDCVIASLESRLRRLALAMLYLS